MEIASQSNFTTFYNHRAEPYFTFLKNGQKTIEGRIKKEKYAEIKAGDHIIVQNNAETDSVEVVVKATRIYSTFKEMLEKEEYKKVLPDVQSIDEGVAVYERFYTQEQQCEFGIVAIEVEVI